MASSSSRKSSSSASKAPKPTYRRASGGRSATSAASGRGGAGGSRSRAASGLGSGSRAASSAPSAPAYKKPISAYTAPTKRGSKPALPKRASAPASAAGTVKGKRPAAVKAKRSAPVTVKAAGTAGGSGAVPRSGAKPARATRPAAMGKRGPHLPAPKGRAGSTLVPRTLSGAPAAGGASASVGAGARVSAVAAKPAAKASSAKAPSAKPTPAGGRPGPVRRALSAAGGALSRIPLPHAGRKVVLGVLGALAVVAVVAIVLVNSPVFAVTDVTVNGSEHMTQATAQQLVEIPEGTTLFSVNERQILESLQASPWIKDVSIERSFPHGLTVTPVERSVKAIAYISADDVAWAIGDDGAWIAPVSLSITVDAEGNEVQPAEDGTLPEGAQELTGTDAALKIAQSHGALLLINVPSDVEPAAGEQVSSAEVSAGLEYANGFSAEFLAQIRSMSVASTESISINLTSGVEVSLGAPDDNIAEKERVVTRLLEQESGVTYVNVREPGAYTFRAAPS